MSKTFALESNVLRNMPVGPRSRFGAELGDFGPQLPEQKKQLEGRLADAAPPLFLHLQLARALALF